MKQMALLALATLGLGFLTFLSTNIVLSQGGVTVTPFTLTVEERSYSPNGKEALSRTVTRAMRGDGSKSESWNKTLPNGQLARAAVIEDLALRKRIVVDEATESITTYSLSDEELAFMKRSRVECAQSGTSNGPLILGQRVVRDVTQYPEPSGINALSESWKALDLACTPLVETLAFSRASLQGPRIARKVTSIVLGEPNPTLFTVPTHYVERAPSEVFTEFGRRFPGTPPASPDTTGKLDRAYSSHFKK